VAGVIASLAVGRQRPWFLHCAGFGRYRLEFWQIVAVEIVTQETMLDPVRARFDAGLRSDPAKFAQDTSAQVPGIVLRCSGIDRARHPGLTRALAEPKSLAGDCEFASVQNCRSTHPSQ